MDLFTITLTFPNSDDYSNRSLSNIRDVRCSMHRPRTLTSNIIVYAPQLPNNTYIRLNSTRPRSINFVTQLWLSLGSRAVLFAGTPICWSLQYSLFITISKTGCNQFCSFHYLSLREKMKKDKDWRLLWRYFHVMSKKSFLPKMK